MPNFNLVQQTPGPVVSVSPTTQAFPGPTTTGNCIVVVVFAILGGVTGTPGLTTDVTDTQGNSYFAVQGASPFGGVQIYVAVNVPSGACTITTVGLGFVAFEYSSAAASYFVCPGSAIGFSPPPSITNITTAFQAGGAGSGAPTVSPTECMVVWGGDVSATGAGWTAATGTVLYEGLCPGDFGGFQTAAGQDDVPSIISTYGNDIQNANGQAGYRTCIILNLTNSICAVNNNGVDGVKFTPSCNNPPSGIISGTYSHALTVLFGTPPYTFTITAGSLPPGLMINAVTGLISGIATAVGTFSFTVQVVDSVGHVGSVACSITITKLAVTTNAGGGGGAGTCSPCDQTSLPVPVPGSRGAWKQGMSGVPSPVVRRVSHGGGTSSRSLGGYNASIASGRQTTRGLGDMTPSFPPDVLNSFSDIDQPLIFNYVLDPGQTINALQQSISSDGEFWLCAMGASSTEQQRPDLIVNAAQVGIRISDGFGYRLMSDFVNIGFFTPIAGNPWPFTFSPSHMFPPGTSINIDLQEQSGVTNIVQIAFRGRYRYRVSDIEAQRVLLARDQRI